MSRLRFGALAGFHGNRRNRSSGRRAAGVCRAIAVALLVAGLASPAAAASDQALRAFAAGLALHDIEGFIAVIRSIEETGRLPPDRFIAKADAERAGWRPGFDLCRAARGKAIGGDEFRNAEKKLPPLANRRWREADLDYACGARGAKRLVFSNDGLKYVTVDHYQTFHKTPD